MVTFVPAEEVHVEAGEMRGASEAQRGICLGIEMIQDPRAALCHSGRVSDSGGVKYRKKRDC